jgi:hypothetical protein
VGEPRLNAIAQTRAAFMLKRRAAGCATWFTHRHIGTSRNPCTIAADDDYTRLIAAMPPNANGKTWAWYLTGENIVWNNYPDDVAAQTMIKQWQDSAGHNALMLSSRYNHVGLAVAKDEASGIKMGVAVFLEADDITRPRATSLTATTNPSGSTTLRWGGGTDTFLYATTNADGTEVERAFPLQTRNAGFKNYDLRYRRCAEAECTTATTFHTLVAATTATSFTRTLPAGTYQFRLRIRDHNKNLGYLDTNLTR